VAQVSGSPQRLTTGVAAAALTPLTSDGAPDISLLAAHCSSLLSSGCSSIVLLGTTGEANSFTVSERQRVLEGLLHAGLAANDLIVGTGCCARGDTIALTEHALSLGVTRVLMLPPFYYKKVSDEGLFDAFAAIIEKFAERSRVYLYSIPQMSGIELSVSLIERLLDAFGQSIAGLKDSSGNWASTEVLCRRLGHRMDVLVGTETLMLQALGAGACGCVSATANVNALAISDLFQRRGEAAARELEERVKVKRAAFEGYPMIPALKGYLAATTGNARWRSVRPPLTLLNDDDVAQLIKKVDESRTR
jgi:4-hydroxy-tetrahydrodipicolinate synthase